jgi:quinol monooxygenase YgiN
MAVFRILEAKARPGSVERVAELLVRQNDQVVTSARGALFSQALRSGDQVLAVSSWRSVEDMQRYLDQDVTREFYRALPELLMGMPSIRTYEEIRPGGAGTGWAGDDSAGHEEQR